MPTATSWNVAHEGWVPVRRGTAGFTRRCSYYAWRIKCAMHTFVADRVDQLLGVTALAAIDRLRAAVAAVPGVGEADAGALVHLQAWPGGSVGDLAGVVDR